MSTNYSTDPRALRTRQALQEAFLELLRSQSYESITVTDIAQQAQLARHTFYNHFETKDELLAYVIDAILDEFFSELEGWNFDPRNAAEERRLIASFFRVWTEHVEIVNLRDQLDLDQILVKRLNAFFTKFYLEQVVYEFPGAGEELAKYIISFNSYTLLGVLNPWLQDGMKYPPEMMAEFLVQLTGSMRRREAVEEFKRKFG